MTVSRIDQSKGRWWDNEGQEQRIPEPKVKPQVFQFRKIKEERCMCGRKMNNHGGVWSYGEQKGKLWIPVRHFCRKCFDKEVRLPLIRYIRRQEEIEGLQVVLKAFKDNKLPDWLIVEPASINEVEPGELVPPDSKPVKTKQPKELVKKTIHLFGQTVEVMSDYGGLSLPKLRDTDGTRLTGRRGVDNPKLKGGK